MRVFPEMAPGCHRGHQEQGEGSSPARERLGWETAEQVAKGMSSTRSPARGRLLLFWVLSLGAQFLGTPAVFTAFRAGSGELGCGPGGSLPAPLLPSASPNLANATGEMQRTDISWQRDTHVPAVFSAWMFLFPKPGEPGTSPPSLLHFGPASLMP